MTLHNLPTTADQAVLIESIATWVRSQKPKGPDSVTNSIFHRNIENALDRNRANSALLQIQPCHWKSGKAIDFTSNDTMSLGSSGILRQAFNQEVAQYPDFMPGSTASRLVDGNSEYLEQTEREIADFHGAEEALFVSSGYDANLAVFTALVRPGDVLIYDELVHASMYDGMQQSAAVSRRPFKHNNVESLREVLLEVLDVYEKVRKGEQCVIVAVESVYSMDGDICLLDELVEAAKELAPQNNVVFAIDEAHSTGVVGSQGRGLVCELGLERDILIRVHTFGKAVGAAGAVILGNKAVKTALINFARSVIFTTAPGFPMVACVRASYSLMRSGKMEQAQNQIQILARHLFATLQHNSAISAASMRGILQIPLLEDWDDRAYQTHILPIHTRNKYSMYLAFHLILAGFTAFFAEYPTVPRGQSRVRLSLHACNTVHQIDALVQVIGEWAEEMMQIEDKEAKCLPKAMKKVLERVEEIDRTE